VARLCIFAPAFCFSDQALHELGPFPHLRSSLYHPEREWQHGSHFGTKVGDEPHTPRADGHFGVVNRKNQSLSREKCPATMLEIFPRRDSVFRFEFKTIQKVQEASAGWDPGRDTYSQSLQ
jgi:hypothetical protein